MIFLIPYGCLKNIPAVFLIAASRPGLRNSLFCHFDRLFGHSRRLCFNPALLWRESIWMPDKPIRA